MPPRGIDEKGLLDDGTLRRFVFQTFGHDRRTQDSPVMPDVWLRYIRLAERIARVRIAGAAPPDDIVDLLLTPWSGIRPGRIVAELRKSLQASGAEKGEGDTTRAQRARTRIALSDSRIVISASFKTLICHIVPMSSWWKKLFPTDKNFEEKFGSLASTRPRGEDAEVCRYAALVGFIDWLLNAPSTETIERLAELAYRLGPPMSDADDDAADDALPDDRSRDAEIPLLREIYERARLILWHAVPAWQLAQDPGETPKTGTAKSQGEGIFLISLNRPATLTLYASRSTVKADAAHRLFKIDTTGITFAVIDGGIDATHAALLDRSESVLAAFKDKKLDDDDYLSKSRVKETYDFTILRNIIDYALTEVKDPEIPTADERIPPTAAELAAIADPMARLHRRFRTEFRHLAIRHEPQNARDLDWEIVRPLIRVQHDGKSAIVPYVPAATDHGTHVAGILAANLPKGEDNDADLFGMCPQLSLYDLRVFDSNGRGDEFAILCALEFVGWLNRDRTNPVIHGVNLSLALAHDVDSFACGQTPICEACNHLVGSGTVVVAAAGNTGFDNGASTKKQSIGSGYRPISITDPGNADTVITVGSTHRRDPHLYGVSYFSARGPTGDGRRKPDILAPGEKITSIIPGGGTQRMDGTSMAAPHVAGAAAMLMARYPELVGRPARIKEILMATATDLKREPSFQGAGLVDVLRALQSI